MFGEAQIKKYIDKFLPKMIEQMKEEWDVQVWREGNMVHCQTLFHDQVIFEYELDITPE